LSAAFLLGLADDRNKHRTTPEIRRAALKVLSGIRVLSFSPRQGTSCSGRKQGEGTADLPSVIVYNVMCRKSRAARTTAPSPEEF
jgi:hypothetical protein